MPTAHPLLHAFLDKLTASLADATFVRLVLSTPTHRDPEAPLRVTARLVQLREAPTLSVVTRTSTQDTTQNYALHEAAPIVASWLGTRFRSALLETTTRNWQLHLPESGDPRLKGHRPRHTQPPNRTHDRGRASTLDTSARPWLQALGLLDNQGRPRASLADKLRQVQRYTEILSHLVRDCGWSAGQTLHFVDMGCGKGYLTFGTWHLLRQQLGFKASVTGVEQRPGLVDHARTVAGNLGAQGLEFHAGRIEDVPLPSLDALIALHACNTATDEAILRGVRAGARLIVVAPCCHQEVRPQLLAPPPITEILRHGLMRERFAEWITDRLSTLHLQWAGYDTRVIEFVSPEHTLRNVMIAGVRLHPPFLNPALLSEITDLKHHFGIQHHTLDPLITSRA